MYIALQHEVAALAALLVIAGLGVWANSWWKERKKLHWEVDGWVHSNIEAILAHKPMKKLVQEVAQDHMHWKGDCDEQWFFRMRKREPDEILEAMWEIKQMPPGRNRERERAWISASCVVHQVPCLFSVWVYNREMLELVAMHEIMRGLHWSNLDKDRWMAYKAVQDLPKFLDKLVEVDWLWKEVMGKGRQSPHFFVVFRHLKGIGVLDEEVLTDVDVLRKALTVLFGVLELPIPRDYRYYDEEVKVLIQQFDKPLPPQPAA